MNKSLMRPLKVVWDLFKNCVQTKMVMLGLKESKGTPNHLLWRQLVKTRTTIVVSNGRYTFYQIHFIKHNLSKTIYQIPFILYLLSNTVSNTIHQISFIKYNLSNAIYQIPFIKYCLSNTICSQFFLMNEWMNQWINRVFLECHICR